VEHIFEELLVDGSVPLRGFVFGFVHVGILLIGYYTGWSINRLIKVVSNGYIAGIMGAAIAHVFADLIAAFIDPDIRSAAIGIVLGGLFPLILIPIFERFIVKSEHHIVVGDHEDIRKDLDSH
jgi:hypothetical protein|tara:strand:+ start:609 stop:977 length:369 start_codon:yes stop_codon:yes gene_type:complete